MDYHESVDYLGVAKGGFTPNARRRKEIKYNWKSKITKI